MPLEIRWIVSTRASSLHALAALLEDRPLVDRNTAAALAEEAHAWRACLAPLGVQPEPFFRHAIPLATHLDAPTAWAEAVLAKTLGPQTLDRTTVQQFARRLIALQAAFDMAHAGALEELELRSAPLREQWEARGGGLLATLGRLTAPGLVPEASDIVLVHPVLGGGGAAHWLYNSVRFEAVLANPLAELPEVLRLGWLLAQLNFDLPAYEERMARQRLAVVGPLALIPPLLAAGNEVELARDAPDTLANAVAAWTGEPVDVEVLASWWETYQATNPPWQVALGALDRMLQGDARQADLDGAAP
jgi:hypothetical protein